jgi:hypothetical protein
MLLTLRTHTFVLHTVSEQAVAVSLNWINQLIFVTETESVPYGVRTEFISIVVLRGGPTTMLPELSIGSQNLQSSPTLWKPAHRRPATENLED